MLSREFDEFGFSAAYGVEIHTWELLVYKCWQTGWGTKEVDRNGEEARQLRIKSSEKNKQIDLEVGVLKTEYR